MNSTFSGWLICIFSYNRPSLLENLISSIQAFYPDMDIAVFDDNSNDPLVISALTQLKKTGIPVYINTSKSYKSKHGGLYELMNIATKFAINHSYRYAYFVQDDMQFLWRDNTLDERIKKVFAHPECVMCNFCFLQKILRKGVDTRLPRIKEGLFLFEGNGVVDTGIIDLQKAKEINLHFPEQSERANGNYWYQKGYRLYWIPIPHLAWVPWPRTFRNKKLQSGHTRRLQPLKKEAINKLLQNDNYAYLEDYTRTERLSIKPYWFTVNPGWINLLKIYINYFLKR